VSGGWIDAEIDTSKLIKKLDDLKQNRRLPQGFNCERAAGLAKVYVARLSDKQSMKPSRMLKKIDAIVDQIVCLKESLHKMPPEVRSALFNVRFRYRKEKDAVDAARTSLDELFDAMVLAEREIEQNYAPKSKGGANPNRAALWLTIELAALVEGGGGIADATPNGSLVQALAVLTESVGNAYQKPEEIARKALKAMASTKPD
jgi:hypothetical protein